MKFRSINIRRTMRSLRLAAAVLCCIVGLSRCTKDNIDGCPSSGNGGDIPLLTLALQMPGTQLGTYALGAVDENFIDELDVLVFNASDNKFIYRVSTTDITDLTDVEADGSKKKFTVKLRVGAVPCRLVAVANLRSEINARISDADAGTLKDALLQKLTFATAAVWNSDPAAAAYRPIPMWGEAPQTPVITESVTSSDIGTIGMVRALARFDVGVNYNSSYVAQGLGNFSLTDVYVYNAMNTASGVPLAANYVKDANGYAKATAPTIPTGAAVIANDAATNDSPLHYTVSGQSIERTIYTAESAARNHGASPTAAQLQGQFCLVVGGYYSSSVEIAASQPNTTRKTYYRIDIYDRTKSTPQGNLLPVLRNHCYKCGITSVPGPGTETPFEALTQTPLGFEAIVDKWDEGGTNGEADTDDENHDGDGTEVDPWENGGGNGDVDADGEGNSNP